MARRKLARRVRFHAAYLALIFVLLDAAAYAWPLFDGLIPIPPLVYAGLGLFFAIASGIGHLYRND
jgi:predicted Na+-dependent transporter